MPLKFKSVEWAESEHMPLMIVNVTTHGVVRESALEIISVSKVQPMPTESKLYKSQLRSNRAAATGRNSLLRFIGSVGIGRCQIGPFASHDVSF